MLLKDFELDFPYAPEKETLMKLMGDSSTKELEKKAGTPPEWKWIRRKFSLETRCVSAMLARLFGKLKTDGCRKIIVECVDIVTNEGVRNLLGVFVVQVKFNFIDFMSLSDYEKKCYSLRLLKEGIEKIAQFKGWPLTPFETVFAKIIEADYTNEWMWYKPVKSPDGQHTAEILCQHEVKSMNIFMVIKDKKGVEVGKKLLISDQPHEFAYAQYLGDIVWLSDVLVALLNKEGDQSGELDIRQLLN